MRKVLAVLCVALAAAFVLTLASAASAQENQAGGPSVSSAVGQVTATVVAKQAEVREDRLAVLKRLQAGELTAEAALDELDKLPSPAAYYAGSGPSAWIKLDVSEPSAEEVHAALPLTIVRWFIAEAPGLLPPNVTGQMKQQGVDLETIDFKGISMMLGALAYATEPTPLFWVKEPGGQEIKVTVVPAGMSVAGGDLASDLQVKSKPAVPAAPSAAAPGAPARP